MECSEGNRRNVVYFGAETFFACCFEMMTVDEIVRENDRRLRAADEPFDPVTGLGAPLARRELCIPDFHLPVQFVPEGMFRVGLIGRIVQAGSIGAFAAAEFGDASPAMVLRIARELVRVRIGYDFCFWAVMFARIKNKLGGPDIPFVLNRAQRKLLSALEGQRLSGAPIRVILLKARQWGGSTLVQVYMAWIQLVHRHNWNSIIVAHVKDTSSEIKGMYSKLLENYPPWLLGSDVPVRFVPFERSSNIALIQETGCKVKLGSAEKPDSARGGDSALAHLTEVAFWKKTEGREPEEIIRSVCGGMSMAPYTLQVYESTANGTGNFFHNEWLRARSGESDKCAVFVAWHEIEMYACGVGDVRVFAQGLLERRASTGVYDWFLWERGATLQNIAWYRQKRREYARHEDMMAEYPSDDIEAFQHSGQRVFDGYRVEAVAGNCLEPIATGELTADGVKGDAALSGIGFRASVSGALKVWVYPDVSERVSDRYVTVVDVGGRSARSDYSVIAVFDRYLMAYGGVPEVVAQWRGHTDHDLLAWKAARIARYYGDSLLVIESNTFETEGSEGEHTEYILDEIGRSYFNLYSRTPADVVMAGTPARWGFHTNVSTKSMIIDRMVEIVREGLYIERDREACHELSNYEKKPNGSFGAIEGRHDDILMTRMIGLYICYGLPLPRVACGLRSGGRKMLSEASL